VGVRAALVVVLLTTAVVASGCSAEDPTQRYVRQAVDRHVAGLSGYDATERSHCTATPAPWFVEEPTDVYLCAAERDDGDCDWFRVELNRDTDRATILLDGERRGCVLPQ
jgi:hypothetical protein